MRRRGQKLIRILLLVLVWLYAGPARAEASLTPFASSSFVDIQRGVEALGTSGDPRALPILQALQAGQLVVGPGNQVLIRDGTALRDATTGEPVPDAATRPVRLNNNVRRTAQAALGALRLFAPDPATRAVAAEDVFHSRDPADAPALDRAITAEATPAIRRTMEQARAAITLAAPSSDVAATAAIGILRDRGGQEARAIIAATPTPTPPVAAAMEAAITSIDFKQKLIGAGQTLFYGLSLGSVLLLAAAGLAISFGVMGVINMAHGELLMLGAYTTFVVQELIRAHAPWLFEASLAIAIPAAFLVSGAAGVLIERGMLRYLYGRPLETLLATWGLSLVLQQAVRSVFGADNRNVGTPAWMSGTVELAGLSLTINRLTIIIFAIAVLTLLIVGLRTTSLGLQMRAVTQNRRMAAAMGIRTPWVDALTFGLGSGLAGIAGVALSQIDNVSPNLGQGYIIDSFMVVVFGGVGNLWGTALAALVLGVVNKVMEPVAGAVLGKVVVLVLLVLFIQRRPRGLFPLKGRAVET